MSLFVVSVSAVAVGAWLLARWLRPHGSRLGGALLTLAAAPLLVVPTLVLLGAIHLLQPGWVAAALLLEVLALAAASRFGSTAKPAPLVPVPDHAQPATSSARHSRAAVGVVTGVIVVLCARVAGAQLLWPWNPMWDDLNYHATMAAHWIRAGSLVLAPYDYHAYFPANAELFSMFFVLPTRMDAFAGLAGLHWCATCSVAVAYFCRQATGDGLAAALATAAVLACGPLIAQAHSFAAVELAGSALITAAAALAISHEAWRGTRWRSSVCGALCGLAIGCKISYLPAGALVFAAGVWRPRALIEAIGAGGSGERLRATFANAGCFALAAAGCGGAWYVRNWVLSGNPLFPAEFALFDGPLDTTTQRVTSLFFSSRGSNLVRLPRRSQS